MPLLSEETAGPRIHVGVHASVAVELAWALAAGRRDDFRTGHPTLAAAYDADPDLRARVDRFWDRGVPDTCGYMELLILAHQAGLLLSTDASALLEGLEEASARPLDETAFPLRSETAEDRRAILDRLTDLRTSPARRREYVALARAVWHAVGGDWERYGRGVVELSVQTRREALARGTDWHEVARGGCDFGELHERCVAGLAPGGELAVVPAFFTHQGLLFDFPGVVIIGVRADTTGVHARARTEILARRLKAISDPTRLAILDALRSGPRTVTELAGAFSLAQPTVSNHVRILREAGIVTDVRHGTRRTLVVRPDAADDLVSSLRGVLAGAGHAHGPGAGATAEDAAAAGS